MSRGPPSAPGSTAFAANYSLDLLRARKRQNERQTSGQSPDGVDLLDVMPASDPQPDRVYYSNQMQQRLKSAMDELSEREERERREDRFRAPPL